MLEVLQVHWQKGADNQVLRMDGDDPQWETLGTMADQNANNVAITGGTISGLAAPLAIADGGTGQDTQVAAFDALSPLTAQGDVLTAMARIMYVWLVVVRGNILR